MENNLENNNNELNKATNVDIDLHNSQSIIEIPIQKQMKDDFYEYSISVITDRALPDIRDGLKPVQRRILYSMFVLGCMPNSPAKKSARIIGDVIGKYHPHGDTSAYEAMVSMSQDFNKLHPLVTGQGNFGSIDGDSAAAMRYTEAKLEKLSANGMFSDIDKDIVDFIPNYDGNEKEPEVLPVSFPNLWVNGCEGIAVGMATDILPHNLSETIDVTLALKDNPDLAYEEIVKLMPSPDLPTGGIIHQLSGYETALRTGRGTIKVRSKYTVEENKIRNSKSTSKVLIITEIPYKINKFKLYESVKLALKEQKYPELNNWIDLIQDESDREGIRIAIYLKKDASPEIVFNHLLRNFRFEESYSYNMVALDKYKKPKVMNFKDIIFNFLSFREEIIIRRTNFLLSKFQNELHIYSGLMIVLKDKENAINLIMSSKTNNEANESLREKYNIDELQAQEVLNMKIQKLTSTELDSIENNFIKTTEKVNDLKDILSNKSRVDEIIKNDLIEIKNKYGKPRLSEISLDDTTLNMEDFIEKEDCIVVLTKNGYIKRISSSEINKQNKNGKGKKSINMYDDDDVQTLLNTSSHDHILFFTKSGKVYSTKAWVLPNNKGKHIRNIFEQIDSDVIAMLHVSSFNDDLFVLTVSENGKIKRTKLKNYERAANLKSGLIGFKLPDDDSLKSALICKEFDQLMIVTSNNVVNRFSIDDENFKETSRNTTGSAGVKLDKNEKVIDSIIVKVNDVKFKKVLVDNYIQDDSGDITMIGKKYRIDGKKEINVIDNTDIDKDKFLLTISENGVGKKTELSSFKLQKRKSKGLKVMKETTKTGKLIKTAIVTNENEIVITTKLKTLRISVSDITDLSRVSSGTYLMNVDDGDEVVDITII